MQKKLYGHRKNLITGFILLRLRRDFAEGQTLFAVSRKASASPAPGSNRIYQETQKQNTEEAFGSFEKAVRAE